MMSSFYCANGQLGRAVMALVSGTTSFDEDIKPTSSKEREFESLSCQHYFALLLSFRLYR